MLRASEARADDAPPAPGDEREAAAAAAVAFPDQRFGPRYVIDEVARPRQPQDREVDHRRRGRRAGPRPGAAVDASDPRVEAARYRLLALGYFLDVRLSVTRGASRGGVVLVVEVEERGTIVINELFPSTSAATAFWGGADVSETNFLGRGINLGGGLRRLDEADRARARTPASGCGCAGRSRRSAVPTASACRPPGSTTTAASSTA